jgi:DNA-binding XRE family transcriptional regulator
MEDTGFGERLKTIRGSITQDDFAKSIGKNRGTIISWEQEEHSPKLTEILKIWKAYKINCHWLITGESTKDSTDQPCNLASAALEVHREDEQEQVDSLQITPQEISGMPTRTRYALLCCALALFFFALLKISNDVFFVKLSVLAFLTFGFLTYFHIAVPYIEKWIYRAPKNLGV